MNTREMKKILGDQFRLESEMYDLILECLKKIYGSDSHFAINEFESYYESYEDNDFIPSLGSIDEEVKILLENREKCRIEREALNKVPG